MSHWIETLGQTEDPLSRLYLTDGFGTSGNPQEELESVVRARENGLTLSVCWHNDPNQEKWKENE